MKRRWILWAGAFCLLFALHVNAEEQETEGYYEDFSYRILEDGTAEIANYSGEDGYVYIPEEIEGHDVSSLGIGVFEYNDELSGVEFPEGLKTIRDSAFYGCSNLSWITLPDGLETIEDYAFGNCECLERLELPDSVVNIEGNPFRGSNAEIYTSPDQPKYAAIDGVLFGKEDKRLIYCPSGVSEYTIPEGIREIGSNAFSGNCNLYYVECPESLVSIGESAFYDCESLTEISMQEGLTSIGAEAFEYCVSLSDPEFPSSVKEIGDYAFEGCGSLETVRLPDSLESIGVNVFYNCEYLETIEIPDGVTDFENNPFCSTDVAVKVSPENPGLATISGVLFNKKDKRMIYYPGGETTYSVPDGIRAIGKEAFCECTELESVRLPDSVTEIREKAFYDCYELTEVNIPDEIETIPDYTFSFCSKLTKIRLPEKVIRIGDYAFSSCSGLTSINLPDCLVGIGEGAFSWCTSLESLTIPDSVTSIGEYAFDGLEDVTVMVTKGSYAAQYCKEHNVQYTYPDADDWLNG